MVEGGRKPDSFGRDDYTVAHSKISMISYFLFLVPPGFCRLW